MGGDKMGFQPRGEPTICGGPIVWTTPSPPEGTKAWKIGRLAKGAPRVTGNNGCGPAAGAGRLTPRRRWRQFIGQLFRMDDGPSAEAPAGGGQIGGGDASAAAGIAYKIRLAVPHVLIFSTTILYSLLGALAFQRLERPYEFAHLQKHSLTISQAQNALVQLGFSSNASAPAATTEDDDPLFNITLLNTVDELIRVTMEAFEEGIRADELMLGTGHLRNWQNLTHFPAGLEQHSQGAEHQSSKWNFHSSLFFTTTLLTSIGYGNLVPISPLGRLFCIFYALFGIPLTLITIADVAKFFADMILWGGEWLEDGLRTLCKGGQSAEEETERRREREWRRREQHEEGEQFLRVPGPYTKVLTTVLCRIAAAAAPSTVPLLLAVHFLSPQAFVLSLLLIYMLSMAVLFSRLQHGWNLLDSLYFTLITMVTIGFGDFCPPANTEPSDSEPNHYGGWILFIIVGLTLSTLTVDLVGSAYIDRIHNLGRSFRLGSFLTMLKLGRGECVSDSARLLRQLNAGAYIPADLKLIPYIDTLIRSRSSAETLLLSAARDTPAETAAVASARSTPRAAEAVHGADNLV